MSKYPSRVHPHHPSSSPSSKIRRYNAISSISLNLAKQLDVGFSSQALISSAISCLPNISATFPHTSISPRHSSQKKEEREKGGGKRQNEEKEKISNQTTTHINVAIIYIETTQHSPYDIYPLHLRRRLLRQGVPCINETRNIWHDKMTWMPTRTRGSGGCWPLFFWAKPWPATVNVVAVIVSVVTGISIYRAGSDQRVCYVYESTMGRLTHCLGRGMQKLGRGSN